MQRTPGTPLNDPTPPHQVEDEDTREPADPPSAGSPSSPAAAADQDQPELAVEEEVGADGSVDRGETAAVGEEAAGTGGAGAAGVGGGSDPVPSASADVAGGGEANRSWKWTVLFGGVGILILALDQLTKALALQHLTPGVPVEVVGTLLKFNLIRNSGAAFSLGAGYTPYISVIQIVVAIGVVYLSRKLGSAGWAVAFGLLFGGAVGNIIDRIFREPSAFHGHVVDFLQTPHWAIFNVADMAVTSAAILLVIQTLRGIRLDGTREHRK